MKSHQSALDINLKKYGDQHPSVAGSFNNLAGIYESLGRFACFTSILDVVCKVMLHFCISHLDLCWYRPLKEESTSYCMMTLCDNPFPLPFADSRKTFLLSFSLFLWFVLLTWWNLPETMIFFLSLSYGYQITWRYRYEEALEYYEKSLAIRRVTFGEESEEVAACYNNIGVVYKKMERLVSFYCYILTCLFNLFIYLVSLPDLISIFHG